MSPTISSNSPKPTSIRGSGQLQPQRPRPSPLALVAQARNIQNNTGGIVKKHFINKLPATANTTNDTSTSLDALVLSSLLENTRQKVANLRISKRSPQLTNFSTASNMSVIKAKIDKKENMKENMKLISALEEMGIDEKTPKEYVEKKMERVRDQLGRMALREKKGVENDPVKALGLKAKPATVASTGNNANLKPKPEPKPKLASTTSCSTTTVTHIPFPPPLPQWRAEIGPKSTAKFIAEGCTVDAWGVIGPRPSIPAAKKDSRENTCKRGREDDGDEKDGLEMEMNERRLRRMRLI